MKWLYLRLAGKLTSSGSKIRDFYSSYVNGLEHANNRVECHIFKAVFKRLITRLAAVSKELRATENMVCQCLRAALFNGIDILEIEAVP